MISIKNWAIWVVDTIKKHRLVGMFFTFLVIGLFLGDGKQAIIDTFCAAGVLGLGVIARFYLNKQRSLHLTEVYLWLVFILYLLVRSAFSDDIGYSLYSTIRYIEAFLIYYLFASYSTKYTLKALISCLFIFALFTILIATVLTFSPSLSTFLPNANLLYPSYGHNHAADILLFAFPASLLFWLWTNKRIYFMLTVLFFVGTAFCFARAVLALEAAFAGFVFVYRILEERAPQKTFAVVTLMIVSAAAIILFISFTGWSNTVAFAPKFPKLPILQDGQTEYWRQAIIAIRERPWFGSGPGTFYLQSERLQRTPNSYSWFAHNYLLEFTSETGLFGFVLIILILMSVIKDIRNSQWDRHGFVLCMGLCLVGLESFVDFNLDYLVVWLLAWAIIGCLSAQSASHQKNRAPHPVTAVLPIILSVFYLCNIVIFAGKNIFINSTFYTTLCSYDSSCAAALLLQRQPSARLNTIENSTVFFHRRNPQLLLLLARYSQSLGMKNKSFSLYREIMLLNPQDSAITEEYLSLLLRDKQSDKILDVVRLMTATISIHKEGDDQYLLAHWRQLSVCFDAKSLLWGGDTTYDYQAKSLYFAALCLVKNGRTDDARELLKIAVDAHTGWSNMYLDFAGLSFWRYHDSSEAMRAIQLCKANINSRKHCSLYDGKPLPQRSVTQQDVVFIP